MRGLDLSFQIRATGADLTITARLDNQQHHVITPGPEWITLSIPFDDDQEGAHVLQIELSGKRAEHTVLDQQGEILQDRVVELREFSLDGIDLGPEFFPRMTYTHDFNGTASPIVDGFFGVMGCNGVLEVKFESPIYVWLLEQI